VWEELPCTIPAGLRSLRFASRMELRHLRNSTRSRGFANEGSQEFAYKDHCIS
jgi:hypothetical protein